MHRFLLIILASLLFISCKSSEFTGFSYDPEGIEDTSDRDISQQYYRTIGFRSDGVWFSNEFPSARMNDVYRVGDYHYRVVIDAENYPINNSPWYGFQVWADQPVSIKIELEYPNSRQRYVPKISTDGNTWEPVQNDRYQNDSTRQTGILHLQVNSDSLWITAQEVHSTAELSEWVDQMKNHPFISSQTVGYTHNGRPLKMVKMAGASGRSQKGVIVVFGRQHPPEVPGYLTGLLFLEELASDTPLGREFRKHFDVWAFPMMNPDGVDDGHWRHNAGGIDLNRDWLHFNQPETQAVRDVLLPLKNRPDRKVYYSIDFHSTSSNLFYPIEKNYDTFPRHFTYRWADAIIEKMADQEDFELAVEPFDTSSPIAKNWTFRTFGADAVTYEVSDTIDREQMRLFAKRSARLFMEKMLEEYEE